MLYMPNTVLLVVCTALDLIAGVHTAFIFLLVAGKPCLSKEKISFDFRSKWREQESTPDLMPDKYLEKLPSRVKKPTLVLRQRR